MTRIHTLRGLSILTFCLAALGLVQPALCEATFTNSIYILTTPEGANLPGSASETNFPILVRFNTDNFDFSQAQTNGADIRFSTPAGMALPYQIEEWDTNSGASVWVRVPLIKGNTNQEIRVCWGLATATNESSGAAVFNAANGFASVIHMGGSLKDEAGATTPANSGTTVGTGVIGKGRNLALGTGINGGNNVTNYPTSSSCSSTRAWFRATGVNGDIVSWGRWQVHGLLELQVLSPPHIYAHGYFASLECTGALELAQWYLVEHTYTNGTAKVYVNGQLDTSANVSMDNIPSSVTMTIGGWAGSYNYAGDIDEVRVSKVQRSANWVKMEYESEKVLQTMVGTLVQAGSSFSTSPASVTMDENTATNLAAQAGGALKVYWYLVNGGQETLIAVDRFSLSFNPGRVAGPQSYSIEFRGVYPTEVKTNTVPVTVNDTIPDPVFTLIASTTLWDGRSVMTVTTNISNWSEMMAAGVTNLTYNWSVTGVAVAKQTIPGTLVLTRAQGSGPMTVTLVMDNGGAKVTNSVRVDVQEPTNDAWVARSPGTNEKPVHGQFYARDDTGMGTVYYNGSQDGSPSSVFLKVYTNDVLYTNITQTLVGGNYAFTARIPAGLFKCKVEYGTNTVVLNTVTNLFCGDAYMIDGQSNAVADGNTGYSNQWIRSFGSMGGSTAAGWGMAVGGSGQGDKYRIGCWGIYLGSNFVATYKVPICIINGAAGGTRMDEHMPGATSWAGTIFDALSNRIASAKLTHGIRTMLWHQGENNSAAAGPDGDWDYKFYQHYFVDMSAAWKQVCPNLRNYFIYQVWPMPCGMGPKDDQLREVQRTLPHLYSNMRIMSTIGCRGYLGCHYSPLGYYDFARLMAPLVQQDNYGFVPGTDLTAPDLRQVYFATTNRTQIGLEFGQDVQWTNSTKNLIFLDGLAGKVVSGSVAGATIKLYLNAATTNRTITYLMGSAWNGVQANMIYGRNGIAALTFADVPIAPVAVGTPQLGITNAPPEVVPNLTTDVFLAGTNNDYVVGDMRWTNHTAGTADTVDRDLSSNMWSATVTGLVVGANHVVVHGTNAYGSDACDAATVIRLDVGAYPPFIDITNGISLVVTYDDTSATVGGTNVTVVGDMGWSNTTAGSGGVMAATDEWAIVVTGLMVGINETYVYGTNDQGAYASDFIGIVRGPKGTGIPFTEITSTPATFTYDTASFSVCGTNNYHVVGGQWVSNEANGAVVRFAASATWSAPAVALGVGENSLSVHGTNAFGVQSSDSVVISRGPVGTGIPYVDITNKTFTLNLDMGSNVVVSGTNNQQVLGDMWISNAAIGGASVAFPASQSWVSAGMTIELYTNIIHVFGSNVFGSVTNDTLVVIGMPEPALAGVLAVLALLCRRK